MTSNSDRSLSHFGGERLSTTSETVQFAPVSPIPVVTTTTTYVPYSSSPSSFITSSSSSYMMTASPTSSPVAVNNDGNSNNNHNNNSNNNSSDGNPTLVIVLSSVLSVVGVLLIAGGIFMCVRCRRKRAKLFSRAITPLDDDEINSWKISRQEKDIDAGRTSGGATLTGGGHGKHESVSSTRKPASVIVYPSARRSEDQRSPRTPQMYGAFAKKSLDGGKRSFDYGGKSSLDKELPQTPIQARAPNAREGLTDEAVPGDDPFIKRQHSRLSKAAPLQQLRNAHARTKSSRSSFSMRSFGEPFGNGYNSDVELTPRTSQEYHSHPGGQSHNRVFSSSSMPPRISLSDDSPVGGLSPRPLLRRDEIGRAIG